MLSLTKLDLENRNYFRKAFLFIQVQYIDHGCIEGIPRCDLYPTTLYTGIPPLCIPCQLYKTIPVSNRKFEDGLVGSYSN